MRKHITQEGDVLDRICLEYYRQSSSEIIKAVLDHNYGLSEKPLVLPAGIKIEIPELEAPAETIETINLWS